MVQIIPKRIHTLVTFIWPQKTVIDEVKRKLCWEDRSQERIHRRYTRHIRESQVQIHRYPIHRKTQRTRATTRATPNTTDDNKTMPNSLLLSEFCCVSINNISVSLPYRVRIFRSVKAIQCSGTNEKKVIGTSIQTYQRFQLSEKGMKVLFHQHQVHFLAVQKNYPS